MKRFLILLEQFCHGAIVGGLIGVLAGVSEYLLLRQGFSGDPAKAYWDILAPYATVGCVGGILLAIGMRFILGKPESFSRHIARLSSSFIALVVLSYLVVWATYRLGLPVLKLTNLIAYAASAAVSIIGGLLLNRALRAILLRLERLSNYSVDRLRIGIPLAQCALIVLVFLWPTMYLATAHSNRGLPKVSPKEGMQRQQPNIVFILIDAFRADHLPIYGYSRQTTPNLTAFARQGMTFTRMYAQASSTRPSVATILSSLYPSVHKANENRDFLSNSIPVLPESLRAAGYKTFGISANANVSPTFGYSRGFDEFKVWKTESVFRLTMMGKLAEDLVRPGRLGHLLGEKAEIVPTADAITDATLNWLSQSGKGPLFLYVHYIDPHDPYRPPSPYDQAFDHRSNPPIRAGGVDPLKLIPDRQDRERVARTLDQYDGEILYADHHFGRLLKGLEEMGVLDNALVIVTADHGEEFFEHGKDRHGKSAYEEVLRVPFLVYWRDKVPARSTYEGMVGLIDIMPTILAFLEIDPPAGVQGKSFAAQLRDPSKSESNRLLFAQIIQDGFSLEMVRDSRYKLVRHTHGPLKGREEFYDLEKDPLERTNVISQAAGRVTSLRNQLQTFNQYASLTGTRIHPEQVQKFDKDTERALRSLGYIK